MRDAVLRAQIVSALPAPVRGLLPDGDAGLRAYLMLLVDICSEHRGSFAILRERLLRLEGESIPAQAAVAVLERLERAHEGESGPGQVAERVTELIAILSKRRSAGVSAQLGEELDARAEECVRAIKDGFQVAEMSVVAGARLRRVIGVGNFGTVWEAEDVETGERVAVKVFRLERLPLGQMVARFQRSIKAMRLLSEERRLARNLDRRGRIARFHRADESGLAFSMQLLSGGDLQHVGTFSWTLERKLEVMLRVCAAVGYSHANGVIHRDIKPANIVLDGANEPVLTDFDIADIKWATSLSTSTDGGLGTPVFAAPEQLENADSATERSDIYSLGRLLYFLLLERSPGFEVERDPSLTNLPDYPGALVEVVRQCTQFDQKRRYESVDALMLGLEGCMTGMAAWRARWLRAGLQIPRSSILRLSLLSPA